MNWLYYLAEANLYLGVFYLVYSLLLNRDTHHQLKRGFLIFTCIISFALPCFQLGRLRPVPADASVPVVDAQYLKPVFRVVPQQVQTVMPVSTAAVAVPGHHLTLTAVLLFIYLAGASIMLLVLLIKLYTLFRLMHNAQSVKEGKHQVIYISGTSVAFSFFNFLFIGTNASGVDTIIRHELVHIHQKHSVDILFLELLKVMNWFNPFIYLLQNSLKTVHEYIADDQTAACEADKFGYSSFLLMNAYGAGGSSITNSFFNYNLLKKRIIMLNQQRSGNFARLKYLVALPVCAALLCTSTLTFSKSYGCDLAPAHLLPAGLYAHAIHAKTRKLLKVTKDGVVSITSQLTVRQKNKKVIYNAGNITKADRSALLKNNRIRVEVVADSTRFTTTDGRLILPVVNADGYYTLDHFLHNHINFNTAKGDKGGLVEIGFSLDNNRHITGAKIVKSGGPELDALALNGFRSYKGIVNDDSGKDYKIGVYFFTNDYSIFKTDSLGKDPDFAGELIITNYKFLVTRTGKGYEYDESGIGFPGNDSNTSFAKVVIFDKNGDAQWFYKNKLNPADLQMLKDKYGYTFPSAASSVVQMMNLKNTPNKRLAYIFDVASYLNEPYANQFYNGILNIIEYPKQAQKSLTGGVVVLNFSLDPSGLISNVTVAKAAGNGFDEAAVNALRTCKDAIKDNAGKHSIAIVFCVAEKKYRPAVSDKIKKEGYVGELAVSDVKSQFNSYTSVKPPAPVNNIK